MPQFRLTAKMASKLKINQLAPFQNQALPFYDDWIVDLVKIHRKEVAAFIHVNTRVALAMPLYEIGGGKYLFNSFPALLEWVINALYIEGYEDHGSDIRDYFEPESNTLTFCKTDNRSAITHLNQFKLILGYEAEAVGVIDQEVCDNTSEYWQKSFITNPYKPKEYIKPHELWQSYLEGDCISDDYTSQNNVIAFPIKGKNKK